MNMKTSVNNETVASGLCVCTDVKAGALKPTHNKTVTGGLRVRTAVKAGALVPNHNETLVRDSNRLARPR